jgi:hypothetical protein
MMFYLAVIDGLSVPLAGAPDIILTKLKLFWRAEATFRGVIDSAISFKAI